MVRGAALRRLKGAADRVEKEYYLGQSTLAKGTVIALAACRSLTATLLYQHRHLVADLGGLGEHRLEVLVHDGAISS